MWNLQFSLLLLTRCPGFLNEGELIKGVSSILFI